MVGLIVDRAKDRGIIQIPEGASTQDGLDKLGETPEFAAILEEEIKERGLFMHWAKEYINAAEHTVSKWLFFRGGPITIRGEDYTPYEVAVFVALFKLHDTWPYSLDWKVTSCKKR